MKLSKKCSTYFLICLVLLACCLQETEATRRVNRGRRTLTRRYFNGLAIPGWAVVTVVAVAELLLGAALYFILYKVILDKEPEPASTYTPAPTHDPTPTNVQPVQPAVHPAVQPAVHPDDASDVHSTIQPAVQPAVQYPGVQPAVQYPGVQPVPPSHATSVV
ncbi:uncharacterized protein LOC6558983 [Drosophila grimshawi]|uniref:GH15701 n=1 Tax=Drosophila grimshawi TaxID=7222 RepID=B4IZ57_DROGR|nr:uncharacterized protein LOC6558983 [Drosophila grimshawi]EDV95579.1 GH15701 [Drosophila grimshawi]